MDVVKQDTHQVKIDIHEITEADYDLGCSILASSVRRYFDQPGVKSEYEEWLKTDDAKRFRD